MPRKEQRPSELHGVPELKRIYILSKGLPSEDVGPERIGLNTCSLNLKRQCVKMCRSSSYHIWSRGYTSEKGIFLKTAEIPFSFTWPGLSVSLVFVFYFLFCVFLSVLGLRSESFFSSKWDASWISMKC